jgi:hypothetical protein
MRVIEGGDSARFAREAFEARRVARHVSWQDLQGDISPEPRSVRAKHGAHPAFAKLGADLVVPEAAAREDAHECSESPASSLSRARISATKRAS